MEGHETQKLKFKRKYHLTLSLVERMMEFNNAVVMFESVTKLWDVPIFRNETSLSVLSLRFFLLIFKYFTKENMKIL